MMFYIYCLRSGPYIHPHKGGVGFLIRQPLAESRSPLALVSLTLTEDGLG